MTTYRSELKPWGGIGVEYPTGYRYQDDVPPIDAYDNNFNYHVAKDLLHLVGLTNERLDSSKNNVEPLNPTDGELWWDTGDDLLRIWDEDFGDWKVLGTASDLSSHLVDTSNPHDVTYAQAGAIQNAEGSVTESHLDFDPARQDELDAHTSRTDNPHGVTYSQAGAAPTVHDHDDRYYTETEADNRYYTQSYLNNALAGKSDTTHNHDTRYYKQSEVRSYVKGFPMVHPSAWWYDRIYSDVSKWDNYINTDLQTVKMKEGTIDLAGHDWIEVKFKAKSQDGDGAEYLVCLNGKEVASQGFGRDDAGWFNVVKYIDVRNYGDNVTIEFKVNNRSYPGYFGIDDVYVGANRTLEEFY
jgi:hypothetical protein